MTNTNKNRWGKWGCWWKPTNGIDNICLTGTGTTKKPTPIRLCTAVEGMEANVPAARDLIGIDRRIELMSMSSKESRDTSIDIYE